MGLQASRHQGDEEIIREFITKAGGDYSKITHRSSSDGSMARGVLKWSDTSGRLVEVRLSCMGLTGAIPASLGELTELKELDLSNNKFTGEIPVSLGNLILPKKLCLMDPRLSWRAYRTEEFESYKDRIDW